MKSAFGHSLAAALVLILPALIAPALADSMTTQCEVHKDGEYKKKASGTCEFSQSGGVVVLRLANGDVRTLTPTGNANEYRSKAGDRVLREFDGGDHVYKWKHRTIKVAMGSQGGGWSSAHAGGEGGSTSTQPIHFRSGHSSGEFNDGLTPGSSTRWTLRARNGQHLDVIVSAQGQGIHYQIFNPDGTFLLEQMSPDKEYKGQLWQSGEHVIEVINRGNRNVSYTLWVGLK